VLNTVLFDSQLCDPLRRQQLYDGRLFVFSPRASTLALRDESSTPATKNAAVKPKDDLILQKALQLFSEPAAAKKAA